MKETDLISKQAVSFKTQMNIGSLGSVTLCIYKNLKPPKSPQMMREIPQME